jgi:acyl-CoA reductase-like NAD-dependent aldehyde dehydrogenase
VHDAFLDALLGEVRRLRLGNGLEPGTTQGPLISGSAVNRVSCRAHIFGDQVLGRLANGYEGQGGVLSTPHSDMAAYHCGGGS